MPSPYSNSILKKVATPAKFVDAAILKAKLKQFNATTLSYQTTDFSNKNQVDKSKFHQSVIQHRTRHSRAHHSSFNLTSLQSADIFKGMQPLRSTA